MQHLLAASVMKHIIAYYNSTGVISEGLWAPLVFNDSSLHCHPYKLDVKLGPGENYCAEGQMLEVCLKKGVVLVLSVKGKALKDLFPFFCKIVSAHASPKIRCEFMRRCWKGRKADLMSGRWIKTYPTGRKLEFLKAKPNLKAHRPEMIR